MPAKLIDANKATSDSRWRYLAYVDGDDHRTCTNTDASKNAASKNEAQTTIAVGTEHESSSKDKDDREDHETLLATQEVCRHICEQASEESTGLVQGNNGFLRCAELVGAHFSKAELSYETGQR